MEIWFVILHLHMYYIHLISLSLIVICDAPQISPHLPIQKATAEVTNCNKVNVVYWLV